MRTPTKDRPKRVPRAHLRQMRAAFRAHRERLAPDYRNEQYQTSVTVATKQADTGVSISNH